MLRGAWTRQYSGWPAAFVCPSYPPARQLIVRSLDDAHANLQSGRIMELPPCYMRDSAGGLLGCALEAAPRFFFFLSTLQIAGGQRLYPRTCHATSRCFVQPRPRSRINSSAANGSGGELAAWHPDDDAAHDDKTSISVRPGGVCEVALTYSERLQCRRPFNLADTGRRGTRKLWIVDGKPPVDSAPLVLVIVATVSKTERDIVSRLVHN